MGKKYLYRVKINGKVYEVEIEEVGGTPVVSSSRQLESKPSTPNTFQSPVQPQPEVKQVSSPLSSSSPSPSPSSSSDNVVKAPIPGKVLSIKVKEGDHVEYGQTLLIFEAMKMENEVKSPKAGIVKRIFVSEGANFNTGDPLVEIE